MTTLAVPMLSKPDAKRLTRRIKTTGEVLWALLAEAHEGQAWKVLGHKSWRAYCEVEFGMTERTAFRVLDQGKVAKALTEAANEPVEVSQRQAAAVKPRLGEAVDRIEQGETPTEVVEELAKSPWKTGAAPNPGDIPPWIPTEGPTEEVRVGVGPRYVPPAESSEPEVVDAVATAGQGERTPPAVAKDPAPREAGEEVADVVPSPATSDPVSKSGGEGVPRASGASLSTGPTVTLDPTEMVTALLKLSSHQWESVPMALVGRLSSVCRKRLGADMPPAPAMKTKAPAKAKPKRAQEPKAADCRHPITRRIGEKRDFCAECSSRVA